MNVEMNITTIREYQPTDKNAVIDLIRQNTPAYFAPKEEADFSNYLDSERELYFVLLLNKKVVGCGGINFTKDKASGKISWDIIHPQYQGKSLGPCAAARRRARQHAFRRCSWDSKRR